MPRLNDEFRVREETLQKVRANPERYLAEYTNRFGSVLNADDAATLFNEYNQDPAKYRIAVHPAATWIRDELFRRALAETVPEGQGQGRAVTIEQLIGSHRGSAQAVRDLSRELEDNPSVEFVFVDNSGNGAREGTIELAAPQDYTKIRERLYDLLDREYETGRITEEIYRRIRGRDRGEPSSRPSGRGGSSGGSSQTGTAKSPPQGAEPGGVNPGGHSRPTPRS